MKTSLWSGILLSAGIMFTGTRAQGSFCASPSQNDCDRRATCTDRPGSVIGYTCRCPPDTNDKSPLSGPGGRVCEPLTNECLDDRLNECHVDAICADRPDGYVCRCRQGFQDTSDPASGDGRTCVKLVDECSDAALNDCDPLGAECFDLPPPANFRCQCKPGFLDRSRDPSRTGRTCVELIDECADASLNDCDPNAECTDMSLGFRCSCPSSGFKDVSPDSRSPGRVCLKLVDECATDSENDCDKENGQCVDTDDSFQCRCKPGTLDKSPDPNKPGRNCVKLVDECTQENDCDPLAECTDQPEGFSCRCPSGTLDRSPDKRAKPGRKCHQLVDECANPQLNDCDPNASCFDLDDDFTCTCPPDSVDKSIDKVKKPGRKCHMLVDECKQITLNECDKNALCQDLEEGYNCTCPANSVDESESHNAEPGQVCRLLVNECVNPALNDCDRTYGVCSDLQDGFECACRPGTRDVSAAASLPAGRRCEPLVNECLDALLNDCDQVNAVCKDLPDGFTCQCKEGADDISPDPDTKPGRRCEFPLNECATQLHDCSRFADCTDTSEGYTCACKEGYFDRDETNPGRDCSFIINECSSINLNDCSPHAECIDTEGGYECRCSPPYEDVSVDENRPGRVCEFNECTRPALVDCSPDARCVDTPDSYSCICGAGFVDDSPDPTKPGRRCVPVPSTPPPATTTTLAPNLVACGPNLLCELDWDEVCQLAPVPKCNCRKGYGRRVEGVQCLAAAEPIYVPLVITKQDDKRLVYSTNVHGDPENVVTKEITTLFQRGLQKQLLMLHADYESTLISLRVSSVKPPALFNATWLHGIVFNASITFAQDADNATLCEVYGKLIESLQLSDDHGLGGSRLFADDSMQLQLAQCQPPEPKCGQSVCRRQLAEMCSEAAGVCVCPSGYNRPHNQTKCRRAEAVPLSLWVVSRGLSELQFNSTLNDPADAQGRELADLFADGVAQTYGATRFARSFIAAEVNRIEDPSVSNATRDTGLMFIFTAHFNSGALEKREAAWEELFGAAKQNLHELGSTNLFVSTQQISPFSKCYKTDCDPEGLCMEIDGQPGYACSCRTNYTDLSPSVPGRKCQSQMNVNECEIGPNDCDATHARCIDLDFLYECECLPGFLDAHPNSSPGRQCVRDRCFEALTCPDNSTCSTDASSGDVRCTCLPGFVDIRAAGLPRMAAAGLEAKWCLSPPDVNECVLGMTNCSAVADCMDRPDGYRCVCPPSYSDLFGTEPELAGRSCSAPLCAQCNNRGTCVTDVETRELTCACHSGYSGPRCEVAAASTWLYVLLGLAGLFLLIAVCCCCVICLSGVCVPTARNAVFAKRVMDRRKAEGYANGNAHTYSNGTGTGTGFYTLSSDNSKTPMPTFVLPPGAVILHNDNDYADTESGSGLGSDLSGASDDSSVVVERRVITTTTTPVMLAPPV